MDRSAVLAKTPKGVEEVTSRAHGLQQKLRSLLIMVDGKATADTLAALTNPARAREFRDRAQAYAERFLGGA